MNKKEYADLIHKTVIPQALSAEEKAARYKELQQIKIPQRLYRFRACTERNISAFDKDQVWCSRGSAMNDAYDGLVYYDAQKIIDTVKAQAEWIKNNIELLKQGVFAQAEPFLTENSEDFIHQVDLAAERMVACVKMSFPEIEKNIQNVPKIACFSDTIGSDMMWGQYAASGTGFALGYDFQNSILSNCDRCLQKGNRCPQEKVCTIFPVIYENRRFDATDYVEWLLLRVLVSQFSPQFIFDMKLDSAVQNLNLCPDEFMVTKIYLHKSSEWKAEREWRLFCSCNDPAFWERPNGFFKRKADALYLGLRTDDTYKKWLTTLAKEKGIPVYQMQISETERYRLTYRKVV